MCTCAEQIFTVDPDTGRPLRESVDADFVKQVRAAQEQIRLEDAAHNLKVLEESGQA